MDLSRLSLKPYKPFAFKPSISFGKEYQNQANYFQKSLFLWLLVSFTRRNDPFQGQALFLWMTFPPLKCLFHITELLNSAVPFVQVVSHLSSPFVLLSELSPVQTLFLTSRAEDTQYLMCGYTMDFWVFWLFLLTADDCLLINPLLLDTAKSFYHHWIWN